MPFGTLGQGWFPGLDLNFRPKVTIFFVCPFSCVCLYTHRRIFVSLPLLMTLDDFLLEAEEKMLKTEQVLVNEFAGVRTGKASAGLIENVLVEVYGSQMRIRELAGITTPEPRTLAIQPWDATTLPAIEKAIQKSNLGLSPATQGKL